MSEQTGGNGQMDPAAWSQAMTRIAEQSQRLVADFIQRNQFQGPQDMSSGGMDAMSIGRAFMEMTTRLMSDPAKLMEAQISLWQDYMNLWQSHRQAHDGPGAEPVIAPGQGRPPLQGRGLAGEPALRLHQAVLPADRALAAATVHEVEGLDDKTAQQGGLLHPPVRRCDGAQQLRDDQSGGAARDHREPRREPGEGPARTCSTTWSAARASSKIRMTDCEAFEIGENIAVDAGQGRLPERADAAHPVRADDASRWRSGRC